MTPVLAGPLFVVSLAIALTAAAVFAQRLDQVGKQFGLPEALLGLLTALAADGPEIASAIVALVKGEHGVGFGVVAGSNIFNLAAMVGLSAVLVGRVALPRAALLLEGTVALTCTLIAAALILGLLPAVVAVLLLVIVLIPYGLLLVRGPVAVTRMQLPRRDPRRRRVLAPGEPVPARVEQAESAGDPDERRKARWHAPPMLAAGALIVLGSIGMVESAVALADGWGLPPILVGVLVLAPLTSLPNALTAVRLGLSARGTALVSETLNSNTINLIGGVVLPALLIDLADRTTIVRVDLAWLVAMTVGTVVLLGGRRGMGRAGGLTLTGAYLAFVAIQVVYR